MSIYVYYVYAYLRKDNTPYYIGKGNNKRAYSNEHRVNLPSEKERIIIMERNLSELGALALERRYIRWYGRKDNNTGILRNMTDGGETAAGRTPWNKGKTGLKGHPCSEKTKQKLKESRLGKPRPKDVIEKMKKTKTGVPNPSARRPMSQETKNKIKDKRKLQTIPPRTDFHKKAISDFQKQNKNVCAKCGKSFNPGNYRQHITSNKCSL